jgi:hypothetical protein
MFGLTRRSLLPSSILTSSVTTRLFPRQLDPAVAPVKYSLSKETDMPMVGEKKFAYTQKGKKQAKDYAAKMGKAMKAPPMKSAPMKKMGRSK